jgi:guanylate kinase
MSAGRLFVVSGPSGGGKTTVVSALLKRMPRLMRSVSVTTRPKRSSERQGVHYRFVSPRAFERLRAGGGLLEWARVHGACYGTLRAPVERALARGREMVLSIDVQGARQIRRRLGSRAVLVFLKPPSLRELKTRLTKRRTDSPDAIRRRLAAAKRELACSRWYDAVVVNRRVAETVTRVNAIIVAERASPPAPLPSWRAGARHHEGRTRT